MSRHSLPQLHIRPEGGWLNDPNGMVVHRDRWHVFFQHNPERPIHDRIAWGHVSSPDLLSWTHHPVAFAPQPGHPDRGGCWSGVHLPWLDRPAVAYTAVAESAATTTVCVREALDDDLETWSAPYVVASTPDGVAEMRDPFCFEWDGRRLALLGARLGYDTPAVLLFSCDDPRAWRYESVWLSGADPVARELPSADIWECPQVVPVGDRWTLILSRQRHHQLLSVVHLIGDLEREGGLPRFAPNAHGTLDAGPDFYAPQVATDSDGVWLHGWIRQEDKPYSPATAVSGCLTLPRRLVLAGDRVTSVVEPRVTALADRSPEESHLAETGVALPRVGRTRGHSSRIQLTGNDDAFEIGCITGDFEIWTDGEVVEVYRGDEAPFTLRQPGTRQWHLVADGAVTINAVAPPTRGRPREPRATAGADR